MKISLDMKIPGALGPATLRAAVAYLRARELACPVDPASFDDRLAGFVECVEHGYTPLRGEIMAAYYVAGRAEAEEAFERGLITESELWQRRADLAHLVLGGESPLSSR